MKVRSELAAGILPVSLLVLALTLMAAAAVAPFMRLAALEQSIEQSQSTLAELRRHISREGAARKENSDLAALGEDARLMLEGETLGIAGANLQKLMSGLVGEYGGTASSFQLLPPTEDGNLMRIPMSLSISISIDGLRDILHRIETGTPLIFIDDIAIRTTQDGFRAPDPHYIGPFDVTLQVSGFAFKSGTS